MSAASLRAPGVPSAPLERSDPARRIGPTGARRTSSRGSTGSRGSTASRRGPASVPRALSALARTVGCWHERARQRRRLRALANDAAFLGDVGLSSADALGEADKPFWRP